MARKPPPRNEMLRMYRHFAVVTVALTGAMALFAEGENRKALAEEMAERGQRAELEAASAEKFGKPKLVVRKPAETRGSFGSDAGEFGAPMDDTGGGGGGYIPADAPFAATSLAPAAYGRFGLTEAEWGALSEQERAALERAMRASSARASSPERKREIARLTAASAARARAIGEVDPPD